jgi:hypothetical protein
VNQFAQRPIVSRVAVRGIKPAHTGAAQAAEAVFIQGERILKRRAAIRAEELGIERFHRIHAGAADRIAEKLGKSVSANAAVIGEEEGKKGVRS